MSNGQARRTPPTGGLCGEPSCSRRGATGLFTLAAVLSAEANVA
jgi:hypothetical protein